MRVVWRKRENAETVTDHGWEVRWEGGIKKEKVERRSLSVCGNGEGG